MDKNHIFWKTLVDEINDPQSMPDPKLFGPINSASRGRFDFVVPKEISLHHLAETVKIGSHGATVLNDLYQCGYRYADDYPATAEMQEQYDDEETGWISILMRRWRGE